jgi:surface antigen
MTYITANTNDMHATAGELKNAGDRLTDIVNRIQKIEVDPNAYDGQLTDKINPILEGFPGEFHGLSEKLSNNGNKLEKFAVDTDAHFANTLSSVMWMMSGVNIDKSEFLSSLFLFSAMKQQVKQNLYFVPLAMVPLAIKTSGNLMGQNTWSGQTYTYVGNTKIINRSEGIAITDTKIVGFDAKNVPAQYDWINTYPRRENGADYFSNCTWYVAAAVYYMSKGKIEISDFHDAQNWSHFAEKEKEENDGKGVVKDINKVPLPGSIYQIKYNERSGHVALVEEVIWKEENGEKIRYIVVSEEDYYGFQTIPENSKKIINISGETKDDLLKVRRHQRTFSPKANANFIHLNYPVDNN